MLENNFNGDAMSSAFGQIEAQRARLDLIDVRLLDTIRERLECCVEIARVKREGGVPMMQPHRIGLVQRRATSYGDAHGINRDFLRHLYELIIAETCRIEDLVIGAADNSAAPSQPRQAWEALACGPC
jgi:chorismate mutase-like protein